MDILLEVKTLKRQVKRNEATNRLIVCILAFVLVVLLASFVLLGWLILREPVMQVVPVVPQVVPRLTEPIALFC